MCEGILVMCIGTCITSKTMYTLTFITFNIYILYVRGYTLTCISISAHVYAKMVMHVI